MKIQYLISFLILMFATSWQQVNAQEVQSTDEIQKMKQDLEILRNDINSNKAGKSKFLLRGFAFSGLQATNDEFTFDAGGFNPLFIYRQSDRLLFESEVEFELEGGDIELGIGYANMSYLLSKTVTLRVGKLLVPFGTFIPNLHPAWINKVPTAPLGAGHSGILPTSDLGVELRGGAYLGNLKVSYSVYAVNGSQLNDGEEEPEEAGIVHHAISQDNNKSKTLGGRLGIFPFSNSSLELGFSGMYGKVGAKDTELEDIAALHYAFDLSYVKTLAQLSSVIDIKAQYSGVNVDDVNYPDHENPGGFVTFDNSSSTWFAQLAIRPALVENNFLRNLEFVGRYSQIKTPEGSEWEVDDSQMDIGINYWLDWRTVLKTSYRISNGAAGHDGESIGDAFFVQWAIGF